MKKELKEVYYELLKLKSRLLYGNNVVVLMYHRVSDVYNNELSNLTVSVAHFDEQLRLFKERFKVVGIEDKWEKLKKTGIVITFDDGYADNILNALPLLEKHGLPATVFVSTLNIGTDKEFWWDRLEYDYTNTEEEFYLPGENQKIEKEEFRFKDLSEDVKRMDEPEREGWLLNFERLNKIDYKARPEYRSLSLEELRSLSAHPLITIGIHTHHHYALGTMSYEDQKEEVLNSMERLSLADVTFIKYLAFPFGSHSADSFRLMNELGIKGAFLANNNYTNAFRKKERRIDRVMALNYPGGKMLDFLKYYQ
jgi:peptidoglycan/xylan/chitin deacetylase (PgdA/CDA1 family)